MTAGKADERDPRRWRLVPADATEEMRYAGLGAADGLPSDSGEVNRMYRTMLAAAPSPTDAVIDALCRAMWWGCWWWGDEIDPRIPASMLDEKRDPQREQMRSFLQRLTEMTKK